MPPGDLLLLFATGAAASGINSVAGGGTLVSFPVLTAPVFGIGLSEKVANATNSVGLWPGSLAGGLGFRNLYAKTSRYLWGLLAPTFLGAVAGAALLLNTSNATFRRVIPVLILLASLLLLLQPLVKRLVGGERRLPPAAGWFLQLLVSIYGGYFGAGMGIMMLGCFALYMEGDVHELNAIKNWLGLVINFTVMWIFLFRGLVVLDVAAALVAGALVGGYVAAHVSQRFDANRLRLVIAAYGLSMAGYFAWRAY